MDLAAVIGTAIAVVLGVVLLALVLVLFALVAMLVRRSSTPSPPVRAPLPWTDDDEIAARHHH